MGLPVRGKIIPTPTRSKATGGIDYEDKVFQTLEEATRAMCGVTVLRGASHTFSNQGHDLTLQVGSRQHGVEVKMDIEAQMGSTSLHYCANSHEFTVVRSDLDPHLVALMRIALGEKVEAFERLFDFLRSETPTQFHQRTVGGFPMTVHRSAWARASGSGLLRPTYVMVDHDASLIEHHYAVKGVHYMQIGGSGLFYLGDNPLDLPVPRLQGAIRVEIRPAPSGSRYDRAQRTKVVAVSLRATARLQCPLTSPYTLDSVVSAKRALLAAA